MYRRCVEVSQRISASSNGLVQMSTLVQKLNSGMLDRSVLNSAIGSLAAPINASIDAFDSSISSINSILVQSSKVLLHALHTAQLRFLKKRCSCSQAMSNQAAIVGGSATVWSLAILSVSCGFIGLLLSVQCCWWTSYCLGVANVIIFFALFGAFALIALPFGDVCTGMPKTEVLFDFIGNKTVIQVLDLLTTAHSIMTGHNNYS